MHVLEFEKPVKDLEEQLVVAKASLAEGKKGFSDKTIADLEKKINVLKQELYSNLSGWNKVQVSRHPERPYTLDYIEHLTTRFVELHGDRNVADDHAMVGGFADLDGQSVMFIGQQKGKNTKMRQFRNFGMANPEGYRKALRLMKLAEKFNKPIITLIDTPGASPGLEAEERGQGEAIARNLREMTMLKVPVICVIIGEGASGGALGIGVGDRVLMLEYTWYSVISPESCSSILWRSWDYKEQAAEALQLTADKMLGQKLIDGIIKEPLGGAHNDPATMYSTLKAELKKHLREVGKLNPEKRIEQRINKFAAMGVYQEK
ncbi:MAG: acetyl-CoA carboxylase carboxyltransferase subunit alpha [Bacteroidia bacterium]